MEKDARRQRLPARYFLLGPRWPMRPSSKKGSTDSISAGHQHRKTRKTTLVTDGRLAFYSKKQVSPANTCLRRRPIRTDRDVHGRVQRFSSRADHSPQDVFSQSRSESLLPDLRRRLDHPIVDVDTQGRLYLRLDWGPEPGAVGQLLHRLSPIPNTRSNNRDLYGRPR